VDATVRGRAQHVRAVIRNVLTAYFFIRRSYYPKRTLKLPQIVLPA
jgi:hypothetical protein